MQTKAWTGDDRLRAAKMVAKQIQSENPGLPDCPPEILQMEADSFSPEELTTILGAADRHAARRAK